MLVDRKRELKELNGLLHGRSSRMVAVSGRRRLGKTTLLVHWARTSGHPYLYWVGSHFPTGVLLAQFSQKVWQHGNPGKHTPRQFSYESWAEAFEALDEFPYAVQSEPGLPSALQNAWDHALKFSNVCMVLCGSHVGMMERLLGADAPLYGRLAGPLRVRPLPFSATKAFFPNYNVEQRVAVYAILGGVPAYLEQFSDELSLLDNLRQNLFQDVGLFRNDPDYLIGEQVRDLTNYQAVLAAIAGGARKPTDIGLQAKLPHRSGADPYLTQLVEMDYVRRELPVTVPPHKRQTSRASRYILADNYLRFYFRFVRANLDLIAQELYDELEERIAEQLRAFVGMTAFEELCREWVLVQARNKKLPFSVEQVGSHWDSKVQVDVAAISWREKALLLGEAKWQESQLSRRIIRELVVEKTPKLLNALPDAGKGWRVYYTFFSRAGFTAAARTLAAEYEATLVDLAELDQTLAES